MIQKQIPKDWKEIELEEILDYEQPNKYIIKSEILVNKSSNSLPVLTANKSFILGYTNEQEGICEKLPVIIFDDFTTDSKYVDFKFKVKSSAMKLLRPKTKDVYLKFIFLLMQTIKFNSATHKRYYLSTYQKIKIKLPPLQVQKRIVSILEKAEELKRKREKADKLTREYLRSIFYEMFLKNNFEMKKISDICLKVTDGKHGDCKNLESSGYYFISAKDIFGGTMHYENARQITKESYLEVNKRVNLELDDVLITNSGSIGKTAIMTDKEKVNKTTFQKSVAVIKPNKKYIVPVFLRSYLEIMGSNLVNQSTGSSQKNLLLKDIRDFEIPLPPITLQQKFVSIVEKIEKLKEKQKQSKDEINVMFDSLVKQSLNGDLI